MKGGYSSVLQYSLLVVRFNEPVNKCECVSDRGGGGGGGELGFYRGTYVRV